MDWNSDNGENRCTSNGENIAPEKLLYIPQRCAQKDDLTSTRHHRLLSLLRQLHSDAAHPTRLENQKLRFSHDGENIKGAWLPGHTRWPDSRRRSPQRLPGHTRWPDSRRHKRFPACCIPRHKGCLVTPSTMALQPANIWKVHMDTREQGSNSRERRFVLFVFLCFLRE